MYSNRGEKKKERGGGEGRKKERKVFGKMEGHRGSLCGIQQAEKRERSTFHSNVSNIFRPPTRRRIDSASSVNR